MKIITKIKSFESFVNEQNFMDVQGGESRFQPGDYVLVDTPYGKTKGEIDYVFFEDGVTKYKVIIRDSDPERAKQGYQKSGTYTEDDLYLA